MIIQLQHTVSSSNIFIARSSCSLKGCSSMDYNVLQCILLIFSMSGSSISIFPTVSPFNPFISSIQPLIKWSSIWSLFRHYRVLPTTQLFRTVSTRPCVSEYNQNIVFSLCHSTKHSSAVSSRFTTDSLDSWLRAIPSNSRSFNCT